MLTGIGLDSAIIPLENKNLFLVQSVDFFYPLCDDGELMGNVPKSNNAESHIHQSCLSGEIAFANVVSDIYACGVVEIDELKILLSLPAELEDDERQEIVTSIFSGFRKSAKLIKCKLTIDSIGINPWAIIGGIATSICSKNEIIFPTKAQAGDAIILTKPLGVQLASSVLIWMEEDSENWKKISEHLTREDILECYQKSVKSMTMLNKVAAELMHKYKAKAATDITGFGIRGHAENLLTFQEEKLDFVITVLPVIRHVKKIAEILGREQKLYNGKMVETSGGLFIALPSENAQTYCEDFLRISGCECWIVGKAIEGSGKVIMENSQIVEA